jgi:glycine/D-amino acid oxidase-like deaminating enzyme
MKSEIFTKSQLKKRFPQFSADMGTLDIMAGFLYLPKITKGMIRLLKKQNVTIVENVNIKTIISKDNLQEILTDEDIFVTEKIVIVSGLGTNEVLKLIKNCITQFPLRPDRPSECKYYIPNTKNVEIFKPKNFPVFAYLDIGIYGHPIYNKDTKGVKIGYYNPADIKKVDSPIKNIQDFVNTCLPALKNAGAVDVTNADQCYYDMVEDDEFILGQLPNYKNIFIGVGWRGTGYKFAPLIGKVLTELSLQRGTIYDIKRFSPARFR